MAIDRKITHNMHGVKRKCSRCPSIHTVVRVKSEYLCADCQQKRRHRQSSEGRRPKCSCGNMTRMDSTMCSSCEDKLEAATNAHNDRLELLVMIADAEDIETLKQAMVEMFNYFEAQLP